MTQEQKAKAYDEALEKAKFYHGNCPSEPERKKLEKMFPQLRESEDERIRKELLDFVRSFWADHKEKLPQASRWVTYLEKQKEQKHAPDDLQKSFEAGQESIVDSPEQYGLCKKPACSEEDEKLLDFWLDVIDRNDWRMDENFCKASREFINRLKSLRTQSHCKPTEKQKYDGNMDKECIKLCDVLNSVPSINTFESCCGHLKDRYSIWFFCNDIIAISRLGRCVERNYSDGKWELLVDSTDTHQTGVFWLRSKVSFQSYDEMEKSVNELCNGIQYWFNAKFDSYFNARLGIIETTQ